MVNAARFSNIDFALLPDETLEPITGTAPSDLHPRFDPISGKDSKWRPGKVDIHNNDWDIVRDFRDRISHLFDDPVMSKYLGQISYLPTIRKTSTKLKKLTDPYECFSTIQQLINTSTLNEEVAPLAFHETVVVGIAIADGLLLTMEEFVEHIVNLPAITNSIKEYIYITPPANVDYAGLVGSLRGVNATYNIIRPQAQNLRNIRSITGGGASGIDDAINCLRCNQILMITLLMPLLRP